MAKTIQIPFEAAEDRGTVLPLQIPDSCKLLEFVPKEPAPRSDPCQALLEAVENPVEAKALPADRGRKECGSHD